MRTFFLGIVTGIWAATVLALIGVALYQHGGNCAPAAGLVGLIGGIGVMTLLAVNSDEF